MSTMRNKKRAYTLVEAMTALLVLALIFAACAPFITKRKNNSANRNVWNYVDIAEYNAYQNPGVLSSDARSYIGLKEYPGANDGFENARLSISAHELNNQGFQRHMMFRYGDSGNGGYTGSWIIDDGDGSSNNFSNMMLGGTYDSGLLFNTKINNVINNTSIGSDSLTFRSNMGGANHNNNTMIGTNLVKNGSTQFDSNTMVGYGAGYHIQPAECDSDPTKCVPVSNNTLIGFLAGGHYMNYSDPTLPGVVYSTSDSVGNHTSNTFVGAYAGNRINGSNNIMIGYSAGFDKDDSDQDGNATGHDNIAVGAHALSKVTSGYQNVAIGYGALRNLTTGHYNVAIGYNACAEVTSGSYKTCIGANSGPHIGNTDLYDDARNATASEAYGINSAGKTPTLAPYIDGTTDEVQRTYIGSRPKSFPGDAVLEIHNVKSSERNFPGDLFETNAALNTGLGPGLNSDKSNITTIINGNLIVRGYTFFASKEYSNPSDSSSSTHLYNLHYQPGQLVGPSSIGHPFPADDPYNVNGLTNIFWSTSDRRLKNIGRKSNAGLAELMKVNVYNYTFKNDKDKLPHVGVIAQDLLKVFPNSVLRGEDGYLRIKWDEMFFAAINAVKELDKKIIKLAKSTIKLETKVTKLEKENDLLRSQIAVMEQRVEQLKKLRGAQQ